MDQSLLGERALPARPEPARPRSDTAINMSVSGLDEASSDSQRSADFRASAVLDFVSVQGCPCPVECCATKPFTQCCTLRIRTAATWLSFTFSYIGVLLWYIGSHHDPLPWDQGHDAQHVFGSGSGQHEPVIQQSLARRFSTEWQLSGKWMTIVFVSLMVPLGLYGICLRCCFGSVTKRVRPEDRPKVSRCAGYLWVATCIMILVSLPFVILVMVDRNVSLPDIGRFFAGLFTLLTVLMSARDVVKHMENYVSVSTNSAIALVTHR